MYEGMERRKRAWRDGSGSANLSDVGSNSASARQTTCNIGSSNEDSAGGGGNEEEQQQQAEQHPLLERQAESSS